MEAEYLVCIILSLFQHALLMYTCIALGSDILSTHTKPAFDPFQAPKFERHQLPSPIL